MWFTDQISKPLGAILNITLVIKMKNNKLMRDYFNLEIEYL